MQGWRPAMTLRPTADTAAVGRPRVERKRLLVVGRDPGVTAVIAVGLRPRFETEAGITAAEALAQVRGEPLSLIIVVLAYFSTHYAESFSLATLARAAGVSPGTLARVFLHDTKRSPRSFRCDVRVEVAKQLLAHEDHKLDRVAELAGFVDGSHLSRIFRLHTGRSPGQYRVEIRSPRPEARCASG